MQKLITFIFLSLITLSAFAADIQYSWDEPTLRSDGSLITGEKTYQLYITIDNVLQPVVSLSATDLSYTLADITAGTYTAQIATSEDGRQGPLSDPITTVVSNIEPELPSKMVITVDLLNFQDSGLEVQ